MRVKHEWLLAICGTPQWLVMHHLRITLDVVVQACQLVSNQVTNQNLFIGCKPQLYTLSHPGLGPTTKMAPDADRVNCGCHNDPHGRRPLSEPGLGTLPTLVPLPESKFLHALTHLLLLLPTQVHSVHARWISGS